MIRLPPSSISLSESDIQVHLKQIDIYQSLLQQGFKRDNVLCCYATERPAAFQQERESPTAPIQDVHPRQARSSTSSRSISKRSDKARNEIPPGDEVQPARNQGRSSASRRKKPHDEFYPDQHERRSQDKSYFDQYEWQSRDAPNPEQDQPRLRDRFHLDQYERQSPEESCPDQHERQSRDEPHPKQEHQHSREEFHPKQDRWHSQEKFVPTQHQRRSAGSRTDFPLEQESRREEVGSAGQCRNLQASPITGTAGREVIPDVQVLSYRGIAPSCVELRTRYQRTPSLQRSNTEDSNLYNQALHRSSRRGHETDKRFIQTIEDDPESSSPPLTSHMNLPVRHRPRQSSMLHITRNVDSPSSSGQSDDSFESAVAEMPRPEFARSPRTRMTYKPRSQTYPWVQSEADDTEEALKRSPPIEGNISFQPSDTELQTLQTEVQQVLLNKIKSPPAEMRVISIKQNESPPAGTTNVTSHGQGFTSTALRPEAEDFIPLKLPPPFSATRRVSSSQHSLPSCSRDVSPQSLNYEIHSRSPKFAESILPRSSSLASFARQLDPCLTSSPSKEIPSSPPEVQEVESRPLMSPSIQVHLMPSHQRTLQTFRESQHVAQPKTPRTKFRHHQTDGPGTIYNDQIPAYLQPRTPADLSRGSLLTERDAAYTAPPGRTARTPASISQSLLSPVRALDPGEESPTRRARTVRERRQRELQRIEALEEEMWSRMRSPRDNRDEPWEHDLAADRVGDENFETEEMIQLIATRQGNGVVRR